MGETLLGRRVVRHSPARLSAAKAATIVKDGTVRGHPLTAKAERYMQAVAHGMVPRPRKG